MSAHPGSLGASLQSPLLFGLIVVLMLASMPLANALLAANIVGAMHLIQPLLLVSTSIGTAQPHTSTVTFNRPLE